MIGAQLQSWSAAVHLEDKVVPMYDIVINRPDFNFQLLVNALSYFGTSGIALGISLTDLLDSLPGALIPEIQAGSFNKKVDPAADRDWATEPISPQFPDVVVLELPTYPEYIYYLIGQAGREETADTSKVFYDVYIGIKTLLCGWAEGLDIADEVALMLKETLKREDGSLQLIVDALSYFGDKGAFPGQQSEKLA